MWTSPTEADEDAAVKKMQAWWAANGEKFSEGKMAKEPAATKPAAQQVEEAAPVNNGVIIHNMQVGGGAGAMQVQVQIGPAPMQDK
jgi:hypothetical protein